jgi:hypothetical protein
VIAHLIKTEKYLYPLFSFVPQLIRSQRVLNQLDWLNTVMSKVAGTSFLSLGDQIPKDFTKTEMSYFRGRFKAPTFLKPCHKVYDLENLPQKRATARAKTLAALNRANISRLKQLRFSHPILGSLTLLEFVMFIGKHEEWHIEQLKRIKASRFI